MYNVVREYKQRPIVCRKSHNYGHGIKYCEKKQRCRRFGGAHDKDSCSGEMRCVHCKENHEAGHRSCIEEKYQQEIVAVQTNQKVTRNQAKAMNY